MPTRRPQFDASDPADALGVEPAASLAEVLAVLEENPKLAYTIYWAQERDGPPLFAFVSFTSDGQLILGLSPCPDDDPELARRTLEDVMDACGSAHGYLTVEEPRARSRAEFTKRAAAFRGIA